MTRGQAVAAGMKDQRLAVRVLVILNLAQEDYVVATIVLADVAANKVGVHAAQQGQAGRTLDKINLQEFVGQGSRKLARKMVLVGGQNIDRKMGGVGEVGKTGGLPRKTPEHQ